MVTPGLSYIYISIYLLHVIPNTNHPVRHVWLVSVPLTCKANYHENIGVLYVNFSDAHVIMWIEWSFYAAPWMNAICEHLSSWNIANGSIILFFILNVCIYACRTLYIVWVSIYLTYIFNVKSLQTMW